MKIDNLWQNVLDVINQKLSTISFNTWFKDTNLINIDKGKATIKVEMEIQKHMLENNYYDLIEKTFFNITSENYEIEFVTINECETLTDPVQLITDEITDNKINNNLNHQYTFDNFIVGESNRFAHASSLAVAQNPGKTYNPLYLHGKSGLGKTHLMHAIGNYIINNSDNTVLYITSDDFITDFISINNKQGDQNNNIDYINHFKNKYRNVDVLLIDDIQFLAGAEKTQQEFFHTFNALHSAGKQIVISSDRSPDDLKLLEERLRTRFTWGLPVNIYPPDFELRCQIIKNKISRHEVAKNINNDVIEYIANSCESDVRHLEGAITRFYAYAAITNPEKLDLDFAIEALKDYVNKSIYANNDSNKIQKAVAKYYNITVDEIKSSKKPMIIAKPRQIAIYLSRMLTEDSLAKIGMDFGGRHYSTIIHACDKIEKEINTNNQLKNDIIKIKEQIK